jgi:hypothetical protein
MVRLQLERRGSERLDAPVARGAAMSLLLRRRDSVEMLHQRRVRGAAAF